MLEIVQVEAIRNGGVTTAIPGPLLADTHAITPLEYYLQDHDFTSGLFADSLAQATLVPAGGDPVSFEDTLIQIAEDPDLADTPVWMVMSRPQVRNGFGRFQRVTVEPQHVKAFAGSAVVYGTVRLSEASSP